MGRVCGIVGWKEFQEEGGTGRLRLPPAGAVLAFAKGLCLESAQGRSLQPQARGQVEEGDDRVGSVHLALENRQGQRLPSCQESPGGRL